MAFNPISALLDIGGKVIDRVWPDPAQAAAAKFELFKMQQSGELQQIAGQMEINKVEAASNSLFVSGWRPNIGWICGAALGWNFIVRPAIIAIATLFGHPVVLPPADMSELMPVLLGILGLGTLRTVEKIKGVAAT